MSKLIEATDADVWRHFMPCLKLISCFIVQFVVRLNKNVLKNCVIIVWLLLMKLKCTLKFENSGYFNFICFITFKKVDINAICFSTCTFKKVDIIHCRSICLNTGEGL